MHPLISLLLADDEIARPGVIDFRPAALYRQRHIRASLHIEGPNGLRHRFSWLPPPVCGNGSGNSNGSKGKPLIVLCQAGDELELRTLLERWNVIDVIVEGHDDEDFWSSATAGQARNLVVESHHHHDDTNDDVPALLFKPSPLIEAALQAVEAGKEQECCSSSALAAAAAATATVLDLGCGAGRDLAWIVRREKEEKNSGNNVRWLATGIDNLLAAVERARLLRDNYKLNKEIKSSSSACFSSYIECLLWAQASTDTGSLQALHLSPTSKSRGITEKSNGHSTTSLSDFAAVHLPHLTYDLILFIRFLPLPLLQNITQLTHNKSIIAISHFTTLDVSSNEPDYPSPDRSKRFEETHINMLLEAWGPVWQVVLHTIHRSEDGRPLRSVLFQRSRVVRHRHPKGI